VILAVREGYNLLSGSFGLQFKQKECSMNTPKMPSAATQFYHFRSEQQITVESSDNDRFSVTEREAAHACRMDDNQKLFTREFHDFLADVRQWSQSHQEQIESTMISVGEGFLYLIFVTKFDDFDLDFNDLLIDFDAAMQEKYQWLRTELWQIAGGRPKPLEYFTRLMVVYADGIGTSGAGDLERKVSE